jgi:methylenetetrahydrofolate dehydrogenase (NADP+)/methenyltetrahydrofolate cyclohydrolase
MQILDGKIVSQAVKDRLKEQTALRKAAGKKVPHLAAILIGNNGASETYIGSKVKSCAEIGFESTLIRLEESISEAELLSRLDALNAAADVDGILVQLPLPAHIAEEKVIDRILPSKDVDGFHPESVGRMVQGLPAFYPATPYGILLLLEHYGVDTKGKHAVVIGRSNIVGRPISIMLSKNEYPGNCTVTVCHSHTQNLKEICLQGDIIIAALGDPNS